MLLILFVLCMVYPQSVYAATASCYGPGLYGNRMANGDRLTKRTLGIAHRTLPLGSRVQLRYKNRRIMVLVKDRGPFIHGRKYDITHSVARRFGFSSCYHWGVRNIVVRRV